MVETNNTWRIIGLSMIPVIILVVQNGINLNKSLKHLHTKYQMKRNILYSLEVGRIIHALQIERGVMSLYVSSGDSAINTRLTLAFESTDMALEKISRWAYSSERNDPQNFSTKAVFHDFLNGIRDGRSNWTHDQVVAMYSENNEVFIGWMVNAVKEDHNNEHWAELVAYHMLINGKERTGIERAIGTFFFANGYLNYQMLLKYKGTRDLGLAFFNKVVDYSSNAQTYFDQYVTKDLELDINRLRNQVLNNETNLHSVDRATNWMDNMTAYIDQLDTVKHRLAEYITSTTDGDITVYQLDVIVDVITLLLTIVVTSVATFLIYKISKNIQGVKEELHFKTEHLIKEQQCTEGLLSQLVPAKIAKRMRKRDADPEYFENVTVLYADIVNLNDFMTKESPNNVFEVVNDVFDVFEKRVDRYNVSKIGTAGNVMLVTAGLGQATGVQKHAAEIAKLALDLMDSVRQIHVTTGGSHVQLKIGISSGPVIAGVIQGRLPRYFIFGDTVNKAKHMMEISPPVHITMTEATHTELCCHKQFLVKEAIDKYKNGTSQKVYYLCANLNNSVKQIDLELTKDIEI